LGNASLHADEPQKVMLKVFFFNVEHRRCVTRIDESRRNVIGSFDGGMVFYLDSAI
jgi:hypothetical protein